jgi:hypothetical protein
MLDIKDDDKIKDNDIIKSCCFVCDFKSFVFISQFIFSMLLFGVSVGLIISDIQTSIGISSLSLIIGVWLPTPQHPDNKK